MKSITVLQSVVMTEKSTKLVERENQYTFWVAVDANKYQIKKAVQDTFGVAVKRVTVVSSRGTEKRSMVNRRLKFSTKKRKKAIVTLGEKDTITLFEGTK